jgi:hypothetical protein
MDDNQERKELAKSIYVALLTNPERYKYISKLHESGGYTHEELNFKNVNKAYMLADTFLSVEIVKPVKVCSNSEHKSAHSTTGFCSICQCVAHIHEQTE